MRTHIPTPIFFSLKSIFDGKIDGLKSVLKFRTLKLEVKNS